MAEENMFDDTNLKPQAQEELDAENFAPQADNSSLAGNLIDEITGLEDKQHEEPADALLSENAQLKDQNLRLVAEMENLRRRTARDVADAKNYSVANFARDMLGVLDNLARALEAIAPNVREEDAQLNALAEGVEMTSRAMISALERHGVKKIETTGAKFDPNFHQAMFEIPDPDQPHGTIAQVLQDGYMIADRVLRPAMVGITAGGAKIEEASEADHNSD